MEICERESVGSQLKMDIAPDSGGKKIGFIKTELGGGVGLI